MTNSPPIRGGKRRLLDAFSGRTPSGPPLFEEPIEQRPAERVLGRAVAGAVADLRAGEQRT